MKEIFRIDRADATSPVWHKLKQHYEERLAELRLQNDNPNLGESETAALRARIAEAKYVIGLDKELPSVPTSTLPGSPARY